MATTSTRNFLYTGVKGIPIDKLPPEAWTVIGEDSDAPNATRYYGGVAFLYRAIEIRANALAVLPFTLTRGETVVWSSDWEDIPQQYPWLANVADLLWQTEASLCLRAQAYWFKERNRARLLDVRWLDPTSVAPVWDQASGLVGYERRIGPQRIPLGLDDVAYIWLHGQSETKPRVSPVEAAMNAAGVIYNADKFAASFFERGAIKATLLAVPTGTSQDERKRLKSWWQRIVEGIGNAWTAHVIEAGAIEAVPIGEGLESLTNATLTQEKREDILSALGVPHSLVMANAANYATSQQDELNFWNLTVLPDARIIQHQLNRQLFEPLGLRWQFKPQQMSIFQEDEEQRAQALQALTTAGVPLALAMEMLGFALPDGWDFSDLEEPEPEPEPEPVTVLPPVPPRQLVDEQAEEVRRFQRWAGKRHNPDPAQFKSDILSDGDKAEILADMGVGVAPDAPFPVPGWEHYP